MKGVIYIDKLKVRAIIGTHAWERKHKQDLVISLQISYDATMAATKDSLVDAINYESLVNAVVKLVEGSSCLLIEKLASLVLKQVLKVRGVKQVVVRIDKPQAIALAQSVGFELSGSNEKI